MSDLSDASHRFQPGVDVFPDLVLRDSISLLDYSLQLIAMTLDFVQVVVGEIAPLLFDLNCFQLPSTRFQSMTNTPMSFYVSETWLSAVVTTSRGLSRSFGTNGNVDSCPVITWIAGQDNFGCKKNIVPTKMEPMHSTSDWAIALNTNSIEEIT